MLPVKAFALELIMGEEKVAPGINFIFEGAIKDQIIPHSLHLSEENTHIHIEARVNWDNQNIPKGGVPGGFIPYLAITAKITNQKTGLSSFIDLLPHINLIDNFHYARNITLPGDIADKYQVEFNIIPPTHKELSIHRDWFKAYGDQLLKQHNFSYKNINFKNIAKATRN